MLIDAMLHDTSLASVTDILALSVAVAVAWRLPAASWHGDALLVPFVAQAILANAISRETGSRDRDSSLAHEPVFAAALGVYLLAGVHSSAIALIAAAWAMTNAIAPAGAFLSWSAKIAVVALAAAVAVSAVMADVVRARVIFLSKANSVLLTHCGSMHCMVDLRSGVVIEAGGSMVELFEGEDMSGRPLDSFFAWEDVDGDQSLVSALVSQDLRPVVATCHLTSATKPFGCRLQPLAKSTRLLHLCVQPLVASCDVAACAPGAAEHPLWVDGAAPLLAPPAADRPLGAGHDPSPAAGAGGPPQLEAPAERAGATSAAQVEALAERAAACLPAPPEGCAPDTARAEGCAPDMAPAALDGPPAGAAQAVASSAEGDVVGAQPSPESDREDAGIDVLSTRSEPSTSAAGKAFDVLQQRLAMPGEDCVQALRQVQKSGEREEWIVFPGQLHFEWDDVLGSGHFGDVVSGRYLGARVAVKVPRMGQLPEDVTPGLSAALLANELRSLRHVRHPNIVLFLGAGLDFERLHIYLVLELVEGEPVKEYVRGQRKSRTGLEDEQRMPSDKSKLQLMAGICNALRYLHERRPEIVHGDLKDSNVLVETLPSGPRPKLLDFGLARVLTKRQNGQLGFTWRYMAPEVLDVNAKPKASVDMFAFGRLVYLMTTGHRPLAGFKKDTILNMAKSGLIPELAWGQSLQRSFAIRCQVLVDGLTQLEADRRLTAEGAQAELESIITFVGPEQDEGVANQSESARESRSADNEVVWRVPRELTASSGHCRGSRSSKSKNLISL